MTVRILVRTERPHYVTLVRLVMLYIGLHKYVCVCVCVCVHIYIYTLYIYIYIYIYISRNLRKVHKRRVKDKDVPGKEMQNDNVRNYRYFTKKTPYTENK